MAIHIAGGTLNRHAVPHPPFQQSPAEWLASIGSGAGDGDVVELPTGEGAG